jgi:uncharacterized membrane protein YjjP (DUF1212 family)
MANPNGASKQLTYIELREVIDLCLWAGQMLMQHGANSHRVEDTIHRMGTGLGCDWLDIDLDINAISITASEGEDFRTKTRRVVRLGVNMAKLSAINQLSHRINDQESVTIAEVRATLSEIDRENGQYNRWFVVMVVGLACAAFSRLFGGDWVVFGFTFLAAAVGMAVRQTLSQQEWNGYFVVVACAFVAGLIAGIPSLLSLTPLASLALAASLLFLVPGVPLINASLDLIRGHVQAGMARGVVGFLVSLAIALGLLFAIRLLGIPGL